MAGSSNRVKVDNIGEILGNPLAPGDNTIGSVRVTDGVDTADVIDQGTYAGVAAVILDGSGDPVTSFGGGTQYTEADVDASITGTAMLMEGAANALVPVQGTAADGVLVNLGGNNDVTVTGTVTANLAAGTNNIGDVDVLSIAAGDNNIGNVDIVTVPTDPFGANADAASATGSISAKLRRLATDLAAVISGSEMQVDVVGALPAGTNAIGKLAANSGVDIGDVDVTSISAGSNLIGDVGIQPRTTNGLTTFMATGADGSSILVATAQVIKASAGKLYGYYAYNPEAAVTFVHFYNTAAASVTVGTTNPLFTLAIPAGGAANLMSDIGITFSNAGWSCAATTTAGGNTAPATGVSLVAWYA